MLNDIKDMKTLEYKKLPEYDFYNYRVSRLNNLFLSLFLEGRKQWIN
jgi:hypothetical protein